jgi:pimeloyl-ACP methyl ester carboxylesterase
MRANWIRRTPDLTGGGRSESQPNSFGMMDFCQGAGKIREQPGVWLTLSMTSAVEADPVAPPAWFTAALAAPVTQQAAMVEGASIAYRSWGDPGGRGIVLVHGGAAHSRWWDHIAPLLAEGRRVIAIDLSGHGDSDRRNSYGLDGWAREVLAIAADAGIAAPPIVIGHSMGGLVTLRLASLFGARIEGAVIIDSPVRDITPEEHAAREKRAFGTLRVYPTREAALARFHPVPDQPVLGYVADHVADTSIRRVDGGWTWKFDPRIFGRELPPALLTRLECRVALFRAEHGIMSAEISEVMYDRLGRAAPVIEIPVAGHHVMLDQPVALVAALRTLLSDWDHSLPSLPRDA